MARLIVGALQTIRATIFMVDLAISIGTMSKDALGCFLLASKHVKPSRTRVTTRPVKGDEQPCKLVAPTPYVNTRFAISSSTGFISLFSENLITMRDSAIGFSSGEGEFDIYYADANADAKADAKAHVIA